MALADLLGMVAPQTNDLGFTVSRPGYSAGFVDVPTPAAAQAPHRSFGSKLKDFLGQLGDALYVSAGGRGAPAYQRIQQRQALQGFLTNPDQAIAQLMQVDAPSAIELYTKLHPQPTADPEIIREMRAAGIDPASDEGKSILRQHIGGSSSDPSSVREYQFAKGQGFDGSYLDFLNQRGGPLIANNGDGTFTIVPRGMVSGGSSPQGLPKVSSPDEARRLPPGSQFIMPDGRIGTVPGGQTASPSGNFPVSKVLDALTAQESGGNGTAVSPKGALGSTQLMPATAQEMAGKLGLPFRPDMLKSNDPAALRYQRALAEAYYKEGFDKTGSIEGALAYYHGGPNPALHGPKTRAYVSEVLSRLGGM